MMPRLVVPMENVCGECGERWVMTADVTAEQYAQAPVDDRELAAYVAEVEAQKRLYCPGCSDG